MGKGHNINFLVSWTVLSASAAQPIRNACCNTFITIFKVLTCANDRRLDDKLYVCVCVGAAGLVGEKVSEHVIRVSINVDGEAATANASAAAAATAATLAAARAA